MGQFTVWWLLAMAAGTLLQIGIEHAARRFRADPQPSRMGQIKFWEWMGVAAMALLFGGAFALYFDCRDELRAGVTPYLPEWAPPFAAIVAPFALAWAAMLAAKPLALILLGRPLENPVPRHKNFGAHMPWFAAYDSSKTYKVFLTEAMLCGAHVGGAADNDGASVGGKDPASWVNTLLATLYDRLDVTSPEFLALDDDNFHFAYRDIAEVGYQAGKRWLQPSVPHSGRLFLTLADGSKYEFLLLGEFDADALVCKINTSAIAARPTAVTAR